MKRETLYEEIEVKVLQGDDSLSSEGAMELLGWEVETKENKFEDNYLIKDSENKKIRCSNNINNRPIDNTNLLKLKQEILRNRWCLNLENRIIGKTGLILNGQHTLIALVLAVQDYLEDPDAYPDWSTEPTIETTIAFGASEEDEVVNTLDTGRPRSLSDVIFRSEYFDEMNKNEKVKASRIAESAVKLLWHRTGVQDAFKIRRTHSEALDFIDRHPRILECVKHIIFENDEGGISRVLSPGYSAGFLYLMGSSATDPSTYQTASDPNEEDLNWELWEEACDFFVSIAQGTKQVNALRKALAEIVDGDGASLGVRSALLVKSWHCIEAGKNVTPSGIKLKFSKDVEGMNRLAECPVVGGIDVGDDGVPQAPIPKKKATKKKTPKSSPQKKVIKDKGKFEIGDSVWVKDPEGAWSGDLVEVYEGPDGTVARVENVENVTFETPVSTLSHEEP